MNHFRPISRPGPLAATGLAAGMLASGLLLTAIQPQRVEANATPSLMEFRWENSKDYRKLYFTQSSTRKNERSRYYFVLRPKDRKSAILKLNITVPDYFKANIKATRVSLCRMQLGGMLSRTKCLEKIPAVIEVNEAQTSIDVFPDTPIPVDGYYAVEMKIVNPSNTGMFQFNALAQAPGDIPVAGYLGSWLIEIE